VEWAEQVQALLPCAERTRFCASGTEATMIAIRIARAVTGKDKIVHFKSHWHGWHDYFMRGYRPPFKRPGSAGIPDAVMDTALLADEASAEEDIRGFLEGGDVAGVIVEPTGPSWGTVPLREGLLELLRRLCDENGLILIFDEMISGFRWSPGGIQAASGVTPDLASLGKILTGGMPGGAVAGKAELMEQLAPGRSAGDLGILHYGTFNAHPLSSASGVATLKEVATGEHQEAADKHAAAIREQVGKAIDELGIRGFAYGESSAYHIYLAAAENGGGDPPDLSNTSAEELLSIPPEVIQRLQFEVRARGIDMFSYNGGVASSAHGDEELEVTLDAFGGALATLKEEGLVAAA
jgi:glutamate-1-semialdehyde 2,1-aminomutase